jgi:hypothetical protein
MISLCPLVSEASLLLSMSVVVSGGSGDGF